MLKIGHRGASGYAPENTLASFKKALVLGADGIEFDVHISKDGKVIVIHDKRVNRTTNGRGFVANKTLDELKQLDAGKGETIPTLEETLDLINRKAKVHIELKVKNTASPVAKIIKEYVEKKDWKYTDFLVSSFNHRELLVIKQLLPQVNIGVLIIGIFIHYDRYREIDAYSINIWSKFVRKSVVKKAREKGLRVFVWTVNSKKEIEKMKTLGVDAIISNYPDRIS